MLQMVKKVDVPRIVGSSPSRTCGSTRSPSVSSFQSSSEQRVEDTHTSVFVDVVEDDRDVVFVHLNDRFRIIELTSIARVFSGPAVR